MVGDSSRASGDVLVARRTPDESLTNDLKGHLNAAGLPDRKQDLRSRIHGYMRKLLHFPEHVRSYFQYPDVQYAAK